MKLRLLLLPCAALLTGCVNFMRTPPDLAQIKREHANSAKVSVRGFELTQVRENHESAFYRTPLGRLFTRLDAGHAIVERQAGGADGVALFVDLGWRLVGHRPLAVEQHRVRDGGHRPVGTHVEAGLHAARRGQ